MQDKMKATAHHTRSQGTGRPVIRPDKAMGTPWSAPEAAHLNTGSAPEHLHGLDELWLLYETSRRISTAMEIDEVIAAYLDQVAAGGRYSCSVALYERDETGERTGIYVPRRWTPETGMLCVEEYYAFPGEAMDPRRLLLPALDAGQTITITDVQTDARVSAELRAWQMGSGRPALAIVPLVVRGESIGLVLMSCSVAHEWQAAELQPYQATAAQLATAIDSRRQNRLLHEHSQQIAVLEERQRLARELHDSVTQQLFGILLNAQSLESAWQRGPEEGKRHVRRLIELSQTALREMRALLTELRPPAGISPVSVVTGLSSLERVRRKGLVEALRAHTDDVRRDGTDIAVDTAGYTRQPQEIEETLFRIIQEALNNTRKHARARKVWIRLIARWDRIELLVADDGIGFALEPEAAMPHSGLGLLTMRERAQAHGGSLQVCTAPGQGTVVEARLLRGEAATP